MTKPKIADALDLAVIRAELIAAMQRIHDRPPIYTGTRIMAEGFLHIFEEAINEAFEPWLAEHDADNDEAAAHDYHAALDQAARDACESKRGRWPG